MTTTLHEQLALQPGICMTEPKEPFYFSDDEVYRNGDAWYESLWAKARTGDLCGESSTHYTKLPTYPQTVARIKDYGVDLKFIYLMRDPVERLISQYIHEWSMGLVDVDINRAIEELPILVDYSRYAYQLEPFYQTFGKDRILPIFCSELKANPQTVLEAITAFIGYPAQPIWNHKLAAQNVSAERMRQSRVRDAIAYAPGINWVRKRAVPVALRELVKSMWRLKKRPVIEPSVRESLLDTFRSDLDWLEALLQRDLRALPEFGEVVVNGRGGR